MSKSTKIILLVGVLSFIVFLVVAYFHYQGSSDIVFLTSKDSYADNYAKKHFLDVEYVSNMEKNKYQRKLEDFDYKIDKGITITGYKGKSSRLVVPAVIRGIKVLEIEADILNNKNIETLVLSSNIEKIDKEKFKSVNIECFANSFCLELKETDGMNVTILDDSEFVDFNNYLDEYAYELNDGQVEIIRYDGQDSYPIIPNTINGYEVKTITFAANNIKGIYIPDTVDYIGNNFIMKHLNRTYLTVVLGNLGALIIFVVVNIFNKSKKLEEISANSIISIISIIYLGIIYYFSYNINIFLDYKWYIIKTLIGTFIYILLIVSLYLGLSNRKKYTSSIKYKKEFLNETLNLLDDVDSNDEYNLRELIRYSEPISTDQVKDIEYKILELITNISKDNVEEIKKLIKKRNNVLKQNK